MDSLHSLVDIGWTDEVAQRWSSVHDVGVLQPGRAARTDRGVVTIWTGGNDETRATTTTAAKDVVAGDWVGLDTTTERVERIVPRFTEFVRRGARGAKRAQVLAANMDRVLILESAHPKVNVRRIERALVLAHQSGAMPVIVITKLDLLRDPDKAIDSARHVAGGVDVHGVSNTTGLGVTGLRGALVGGSTVAALGASGVGKSSLVNALAGREVQLVGEVRRGDGKGRHTTTAAQLIKLDGLLFIDTPGVRALALWGDGSGLDLAFPEIAAAAELCRFDDCSHVTEPGCEVRAAVVRREIDPARLAQYGALWDELSEPRGRRSDEPK